MASESSSAMLDLNDADTEDTEAPSVTDDAREGVPLMMEPGYDIAVKVDAPMKQLSTLETFVTYRVRCVCARWPTPPAVRRRYNHFKLLHLRLASSQAWLAPPALPPLHSARQQLDRYCASFVAVRTLALHAFLDRIAKHPIFTHSEDFRLFLTTPDEELDKVFKSENSALNLWGFGSALYGGADNKPSNGARVKDPEWSSHAEYLTSLQQKLTTLCSLTTRLHRGTAALNAEMINMKRTCDAWASQARGGTARGAGALGAALPAPAPAAPGAPPACPRAGLRPRALLPLLATYTAAHLDKIRQRDALHAAYVAGSSTTGDLHNKLQQASEALRAELSDWLPKTRAEVKSILLELANGQVCRLTQAHAAWEHALKLSNDPNVADLFKTVSKAAVQNLSPSKCRSETTPTETERDLDELENCSEDSDAVDQSKNSTDWVEVNNVQGVDPLSIQEVEHSIHGVDPDCIHAVESLSIQDIDPLSVHEVESLSIHGAESLSIHGAEPLSIQGVVPTEKDFLSEILDDSGQAKSDSASLEQSLKSDVVSDPLREFSDVDLGDRHNV